MLGHFRRVLEGIVADPDQRIGELPLLSDAEKQQLLLHWNDTWADYPKDRCIHQLFEAQVEKSPDAIAVVCEDKQLSYRELNNRANQLARYLQKLGVGPEVLVGNLPAPDDQAVQGRWPAAVPLSAFVLSGMVVVMTLVLWALYRWTRFGLATRAASQSARAQRPDESPTALECARSLPISLCCWVGSHSTALE